MRTERLSPGTAKTDIILMLGATILGLSLASQALFYAIPSETLPRKWRSVLSAPPPPPLRIADASYEST